MLQVHKPGQESAGPGPNTTTPANVDRHHRGAVRCRLAARHGQGAGPLPQKGHGHHVAPRSLCPPARPRTLPPQPRVANAHGFFAFFSAPNLLPSKLSATYSPGVINFPEEKSSFHALHKRVRDGGPYAQVSMRPRRGPTTSRLASAARGCRNRPRTTPRSSASNPGTGGARGCRTRRR